MAGIEDHHAVLDRGIDHGAVRADDVETAMKVAVVGMARSGIAAAELLLSKGETVWGVDEKLGPGDRGLGPVKILPQTDEAFEGADLIVLSPGVPADLREWYVPVIGDLELASWFMEGPIIGITGANGKTTTTALTGHILGASAQVGGNIGRPPCSMVATSRAGQWNVLELSSFQLETTQKFRAQIGACLNVTPDHLDRHHTFENYAEAKARLFVNQRESDFAVLNADDATCRGYVSRGAGRPVWFSSTQTVAPGAYLEGGDIFLDGEKLMAASEVPLRGVHNLENTMAAAAIARLAGSTHEQIRAAVMTFPGVEHRLEFVRDIGGVAFYNDSKATNVDATLKAINAFEGGLWIILGGKDKNSDYSVLRDPLAKKARAALLIGAAAKKIDAQLDSAVPIIHSGTLENAVKEASARSSKGDTVLLAPACASYDQFENFEHRGREFKRLVAELPWPS
jgi:UDP-N-acetylmuramoylalanine--D-glutamate ligase